MMTIQRGWGAPDPKPQPRVRDARAGVDKLKRENHCRACGVRAGRHVQTDQNGRVYHGSYRYVTLTRHHLVPRSRGGDDVDANLVPLCGDGVLGCHGIIENKPTGWERTAMALRANLTPDEIEYIVGKTGPRFLARYYPEDG